MTGRRRFVRDRDGRIRPGLDRMGRQLLQSLPRQAQSLLEHDDPSAARVFPVAYPDDERAEAEYREMLGSQLLQRHQQALDTLAATVDSPTVDEDELQQWLNALEILRLVLGTQLDVSEDMTEVSPFDPQAQQLAVYQYLSILQGEIVDALAEGLPVVEDDDLTADDLLDDGFGDVTGRLLDDELDDPNWMDFPDNPDLGDEGPAGRGR